MPKPTATQIRQLVAGLVAGAVAVAAVYGIDASFLNSPILQGAAVAIITAAVSLFIPDKPQEPSLADAYHKVEAARQAREAERWATAADPQRVYDHDENERP